LKQYYYVIIITDFFVWLMNNPTLWRYCQEITLFKFLIIIIIIIIIIISVIQKSI